jgi:hypothetical protein
MSMTGRTAILLLLAVAALVVTGAGTGPAGAFAAGGGTGEHRAGAQDGRTRQATDAGRTTTVVREATTREDRSAPITVLLVGVGAAVGVLIGVIPAVAAAMLLGYLPPPRLARAGGVLVEPPSAARPEPAALPPAHQPEGAPQPAVRLAAAPEPPAAVPEPAGQLAILAHARHQGVYDAAYAEQLERVEALRAAIGDRRREPPEPPTD